MNELLTEVLDTVEILNSECKEGGMEYYLPYSFEYYGWQNGLVRFMGVVLWTEENDERDYLEDNETKESMYGFLKKEGENITKDLGKKIYNTNWDIVSQFRDFLVDYSIDGISDEDINEFLSGYYE